MKTVTTLIYATVALTILSACSILSTTDCETPTLTPAGGTYAAGSTIMVTIETKTVGAYLSWTDDGTQPTPTGPHIIKAQIGHVPIRCVFGRTMRLQAIAFKPGGCVSPVASGDYVGQ
jgi:chitobiase/beta-hexosaminidase-like protein